MKKLYNESKILAEDAKKISDEIFKYNPGAPNSKMPISDIAQMISRLMYLYSIFRLDLIKKDKDGGLDKRF